MSIPYFSLSLELEIFISTIINCKNIFQVKQVHALVTTYGVLHSRIVANKLLCAYTHHKDIGNACILFDKMSVRDLVSWNVLISGFSKVGDYMHCLETFKELIRNGVQPDNYTLPFVIRACKDKVGLNVGRLIHSVVVKDGLQLDKFVCASLLDMYAKFGVIDDAQKLFDKMPNKDLVTSTVMIGAYAESGNAKESLLLFDQMRKEGFVPDKIVMVSIVNACAKLGAMNKAKLVHDYLRRNKFSLDGILGTAMIDMYAKCGSVDSAREIFDSMQQKNVISWSAMIAAYGSHGQGRKALELFSMMCSSGILPNKITFVSLLHACSHSGLVEDGVRLFSLMSESYGVRPDVKHYTCMVDLLGRAGRLNEALEYIENMTVEKDEGLLSTFLGACRIHKHIDFAEEAAKSLLELRPKNPLHYILLSNIYAKTGRWKDVGKIRDLMIKRKFKKIPAGFTLIEVENIIYKFNVADSTHPLGKDIYKMLRTLNKELKLAGYVPDTNFLLHNIDEECRLP